MEIAAGGQLTTTTDIENFPGFPEGIGGLELTERFAAQSKRFGTEIVPETVSRVDFSARPFKVWLDGQDEAKPAILAHSVIVATWRDVPQAGRPRRRCLLAEGHQHVRCVRRRAARLSQ